MVADGKEVADYGGAYLCWSERIGGLQEQLVGEGELDNQDGPRRRFG